MNKKIKVAIKIILPIIVIIGIIYIISRGEKVFNKVELSNNNSVLNRTSIKFIDTIVSTGLDELKIKNVFVLLRPITIVNKEEGTELIAHIVKGSNHQYLIEVRNSNRQELIYIISHELIHLKQLEDGKFKNSPNYVVWKSDTLYIKDIPDYFSRPWEIEAIELSTELDRNISSKLFR
jgi:hypothetical protein